MLIRAHAVALSILLLVLGLAACAGKTKPDMTREQASVDYDLLLNLPEDRFPTGTKSARSWSSAA